MAVGKNFDRLLTLGIETSCDDTAVAVIRGEREILSALTRAQDELHACFGGVAPEVASRRHAEIIDPVTRDAVKLAGVEFSDIDLIGVTNGPGLAGSLLVGLSYAKALAWALDKPIMGINHIEGHMAAAYQSGVDLALPILFLVVSGGHTELYLLESEHGAPRKIGQTLDDAVGEAFDKVARALGLGYPGGPRIERAARSGSALREKIPVAIPDVDFDFSFSGPKTAATLLIKRYERAGEKIPLEDIAASFQSSAIAALELKTRRAIDRYAPKSLAVVGGVARNEALRARMNLLADEKGIAIAIPEMALCVDNGVMIAIAAARRARSSALSLDALSADHNELDADPSATL